jgi:hypothetical protein
MANVQAMAAGGEIPTPEAVGVTAAVADNAADETTTLYRTVSTAEKEAIEASGQYEAASGGVEGKYFYPTTGQAQTLAEANFSTQGEQWLTSVEVNSSTLQQATRLNVAGEGQVLFYSSEQLSSLGKPQVWSSFPVTP